MAGYVLRPSAQPVSARAIATVGREHAVRVRDVFAIKDDSARRAFTAAWYWHAPPER
jgi:hypothetical protein